MFAAAGASGNSTPSPVVPKQLTPLTPASARKDKNKHSSRPPSADEHSRPVGRTNQPRESWVRSPSPAFGSPGRRSRAAGQRSASPAVGSVGQRSNDEDGDGGSRVFSKRSSSLANKQQRTTNDTQQTSVICCC